VDELTNWGIVGCHRGTFQSAMPPITLCPNSSADLDPAFDPSLIFQRPQNQYPENTTTLNQILEQETETVDELVRLIDQVNVLSQGVILKRDTDLMRMGRSSCSEPGDESSHQNPHVRQLFRTCFPGSKFSALERQCSPECVPLNECVLAIAWEAILNPLSHSLFSGGGTPEALAKLLPRAATYQANYHTVLTSCKVLT
jgi:hypothetical protein